MKFRIAIHFLAGLLLFGASNRIPGSDEFTNPQAQKDEVNSAIHEAQISREKAAAAGAEWLQTGSLIEQSQVAAHNGEWQRALALAEQARQQAQLAVEQAGRESAVWRERVVR